VADERREPKAEILTPPRKPHSRVAVMVRRDRSNRRLD
jgi:hypothetical protein